MAPLMSITFFLLLVIISLSTLPPSIRSQSCQETGNYIDDCWRLDENWADNRFALADCALGFGQAAQGGRDGAIYTVTDPSDDSENPAEGTLRYGVIQTEPLWIVFQEDMTIKLQADLTFVNPYKTIDGRGANVEITGGAGLVLEGVSNIIIHGIRVHNIVYSTDSASVRLTPKKAVTRDSFGEDGIRVIESSKNIWIDHCYLSECYDGLLDVTRGSTDVTISNCVFENHNKVMLLSHSDDYDGDADMRVTVALNRFGPGLTQRMPRCRFGNFHVVNNDYLPWESYAIGGSSDPTIYSEGNRFTAGDSKEVTKRMEDDEAVWSTWDWASEGDLFKNGAFFTPSGSQDRSAYADAISLTAASSSMVAAMTADAGPLLCQAGSACCSSTSEISLETFVPMDGQLPQSE